jgi:hypothetical protein
MIIEVKFIDRFIDFYKKSKVWVTEKNSVVRFMKIFVNVIKEQKQSSLKKEESNKDV